MVDRVYWALENKYISILVNDKDALLNGYSLEKSSDSTIESIGNTIGVIYWDNKAWISVDKGPFGWDDDGYYYGLHEEANIELCYINKKI